MPLPRDRTDWQEAPMRRFYLAAGIVSVALGIIGILLPIMPTVPFLILAAWCFGKSNREFERRLLENPHFGPSIRAWREKGAIGRNGKLGATFAFTASCLISFAFAPMPWPWVTLGIAVVCLSWILTRPSP